MGRGCLAIVGSVNQQHGSVNVFRCMFRVDRIDVKSPGLFDELKGTRHLSLVSTHGARSRAAVRGCSNPFAAISGTRLDASAEKKAVTATARMPMPPRTVPRIVIKETYLD